MRSLFSFWHFDFITIGFVALLCLLYLYAIDFKLRKYCSYFFSGIFLLIICVDSPLHFLGEKYLFSAHMTVHVLLLLITAPLLVAGIPPENKFKRILVIFSKKISAALFATWIGGVFIMWFWHIPFIFNQLIKMQHATNSNMHLMSSLMYIHLFSLLIAGIILSWPIINPYSQHRISSLSAVLYLSTACIFCSLLGLLITFAPVGMYTQYTHPMYPDVYLSSIRNEWGISEAADQQMGGLIMWVPCCIIYLSVSMYLLVTWFENKDAKASLPNQLLKNDIARSQK
jgi:putative membrane protein